MLAHQEPDEHSWPAGWLVRRRLVDRVPRLTFSRTDHGVLAGLLSYDGSRSVGPLGSSFYIT